MRRYQSKLYLIKGQVKNDTTEVVWSSFPEPLLFSSFELFTIPAVKGFTVPPHADIRVRFRKGGEEFFWHKQTKSLKKLMQQWHIPPWLRDEIPLIYFNDVLAVIVGYAISDRFYTESRKSYQIEIRFKSMSLELPEEFMDLIS